MALDIREGDTLMVGSTEYPIRFVGAYDDSYDPSLALECTVSASTKRGTISSGHIGAYATVISSLYCTKIDPAAQDLQQRIILKGSYILKECFARDSSDGSFVRLALEALK